MDPSRFYGKRGGSENAEHDADENGADSPDSGDSADSSSDTCNDFSPTYALSESESSCDNDSRDNCDTCEKKTYLWECFDSLKKQLEQGTTLIVDRYSDSGIAFSAAKGLPLEWCAASDAGLLRPDLVLFLTLTPSEVKARGGYGQERYEEDSFQEKVRNNFNKLKRDYWTVINADQKNIEELQSELLEHVTAATNIAKDKPLLTLDSL